MKNIFATKLPDTDVSIPSGNNYSKAFFRIWIPESLEQINGILVLVPGSNCDGRDMADDETFREFALKHNHAILACYFTDKIRSNKEKYCKVSEGSGDALLEALNINAKRTNHPELETAKFLLWGHSAGGQFNYEFVCWRPEKVSAFVVNKGGYYYTTNPPEAALKVPGIFFIGELDSRFRIENIKSLFENGKSRGADWKLFVEKNTGHEEGVSKKLGLEFFDQILKLSLG